MIPGIGNDVVSYSNKDRTVVLVFLGAYEYFVAPNNDAWGPAGRHFGFAD